MSNEIIKGGNPSLPSSTPVAPVFSAHAEGDGIAVGYADSFAPTINLFLPDGSKSPANPESKQSSVDGRRKRSRK